MANTYVIKNRSKKNGIRPRGYRHLNRSTTNLTTAPSSTTTVHNSPPLTQDNIRLEESDSGDKLPTSPSVADLDSITNIDELKNIFEGLDIADGDSGDRVKEGK